MRPRVAGSAGANHEAAQGGDHRPVIGAQGRAGIRKLDAPPSRSVLQQRREVVSWPRLPLRSQANQSLTIYRQPRAFRRRTSTTASWKDAATSARTNDGVLSR